VGSRELLPRINFVDPSFVSLSLALYREAARGENCDGLLFDTLSQGLAAYMLQAHARQPQRWDTNDPRLKRVISLMEAELGNALSLDRLARVANMSAFHFARSFKSAYGKSPYRFLSELRIRKARELLESTRLPVNQIANEVGWANVARFSSVFKAHTGVSPLQFRNLRK
jgi:AraC family transcriptional regulator